MHHDERIDVLVSLQKQRSQFALLVERLVQKIARLILRLHDLGKIFVDDEHLLDKPFGDNILFGHFDEFRLSVRQRRRRATDYLVRLEQLHDLIGFRCKVLMAFVDNDLKRQSVVKRFFYPFEKVGALAVLQSVITLFGQLLPIDKASVVFGKAACHHVSKEFCLRVVDIFVHLRLALLFKIALARREPHKHRLCVPLHILVYEVCENDCLTAARRAFEDNVAARLFHAFQKRLDYLQLKLHKVDIHFQPSNSR